MSVEPLTTGTPVRAPRTPHAPRPARTTPSRPRRTTRPGAAPSRARLASLPAARSAAPRAPFVLLIVALLGLGLLALLFLNTASAQDAFRLSDLQRQSKSLADQQQALARQAADQSDPASVAAAAARLGMVPGAVPIFLAPGQKIPAGQVVDGMVIVSAPKSTQPAPPVQHPQPTPSAKSSTGTAATKKTVAPSTKKPAVTGGTVSPDVVQALKNFQQFQRFADAIAAQQRAKQTTTPGAHP